MKNEILKYLNQFSDDEFHPINDFIKAAYGEAKMEQAKGHLQKLSDSKPPLIEVFSSKHTRWGIHTPNIHPDINVIADLNNWEVKAKITDEGRDKLKEQTFFWYQTENAKLQYEDYPRLKRQARIAIIVSIIAIAVPLILELIRMITKKQT